MGKDKKNSKVVGDLGSFKTKDTLRDEDIELTKNVRDLERRYKNIYRSVEELSQRYGACKSHFAIERYTDLKDMIKACVTDETMQQAARYSAAQNDEEKGKIFALAKAAKQLSSEASASVTDEVMRLHKAEIVKDIEDKKRRVETIEKKFLRLHNRLQKLKRDYEESKRHIPTKRYLVMKEIIKPIIRDDALRVDS